MPATFNCGLGRVHKALNNYWKPLLEPAVYRPICENIQKYIDDADNAAYDNAVAQVMAAMPGYSKAQAELLIAFAFPEIPGGPDSDW